MSDLPAFQGPLTRNLQAPALDFCRLLWNDVILNAPEGEFEDMDVSHRDLAPMIWQMLPGLDLMDLAFLYKNLQDAKVLQTTKELQELFQFYGFQWNSRLAQLCQRLLETPLLFKDWVRLRKAAPKDLFPLLSVKDMEDFLPSLERICDLRASRSEGKALLDLLVDLELSGDNGPWQSESVENWLMEVRKKRYPQTHQRDSQSHLDLNLPQFAECRKKREGDRLMHRLSFSFLDRDEALQKIQRLQQNMTDTQ